MRQVGRRKRGVGERGGLIDFGCTWLSWFLRGGRFDRWGGGSARTFLGRKQKIDVHDY